MIHCELLSVCGVRLGSKFSLLRVAIQLSWHMKRLFFSSLNGLGTFVENQLSVVYDFVSELSILINVK